jgi:phosphonate transport system substrate-binding protein
MDLTQSHRRRAIGSTRAWMVSVRPAHQNKYTIYRFKCELLGSGMSFIAFIFLLVSTIIPTEPADKDARNYYFGIVPQQSPMRLVQLWLPTIEYLKRETGINIHFATKKSIPEFESCLASKAYDLAYMNPIHYVVFRKVGGYNALARDIGASLRGLIVVPRDSSVRTLSDLRGMTIAFPSPGAFAASILPRQELQSLKIAFAPSYVRSHDSVYLTVASGIFPAGGGISRTFNAMSTQIKSKLRVLHSTRDYPTHAIATRSDMPEADRRKLLLALQDMSRKANTALKLTGIVKYGLAKDADWKPIRALNIDFKAINTKAETKILCR